MMLMNHLDLLYAGLAAMATGILVYLGLTTAAQEEPDTMDLDVVALAALERLTKLWQ
jgi:hypothetical protein